jgi:4-hydroxy-2-oxoglutarate aldolase
LKLAQAEWAFAKEGINGTKWVVAKYLGYPESSCHTRRPYPKFVDTKKQAWISETLSLLLPTEERLKLAVKK